MGVNHYYSHYVYPGKENKVYILAEHYSAGCQKTIGVVTGRECILAVNTGMGMHDDIRKYIEEVVGTDRPIECVCLTGEAEDTGAVKLFDAAYIEPSQKKVYDSAGSDIRLRRQKFVEQTSAIAETLAYGERRVISNSGQIFKPAGDGTIRDAVGTGDKHFNDRIGEGYTFHLGGTVVEMAELPAQSPGQLIAICSTCSISFTGKAIEPVTDLRKLDREGLERYASALERILEHTNSDTVYNEGMKRTAHKYYCDSTTLPMEAHDVENVLQACREVLGGDTQHDMPADIYPCHRIHFVENGGIIYDRAKVAEKGTTI